MFFLKSFVIAAAVALVSGTPAVENRAGDLISRQNGNNCQNFIGDCFQNGRSKTTTLHKRHPTNTGTQSQVARVCLSTRVTPLEPALQAHSTAAPAQSAAVVLASLVVVGRMDATASRAHALLEHSRAALATNREKHSA
ncbi:hypothetical protein VKT23_011896 [Stygiomarasmius scandens]|uniref:Uncharacterized protein n=1 Tax=Marasmiellus scandens TaxID=2682957 RepID=A0ABR1JAL9_9AGAR